MARSNLGPVLTEIFKHEGGYADHPNDPGGATNMGITHKTLAAWRGVNRVTKDEVKALGKGEALDIYRANYWDKVHGDNLPYGLDLVTMDGAVNSGPSRGVRWMQKGVGAKADGKVGPITIEKARAAGPEGITAACAARMGFLQGLRTWGTFGRGWSRRVASVEAVGLRMYLRAVESDAAAKAALTKIKEDAPTWAKDERRAGVTQAGATSAGGVGGVSVTEMPLAAVAALALGAVAVAALLYFRAERKARYNEDLANAVSVELEALS